MNSIILKEIKFKHTILYFRFETKGNVSKIFTSNELWIDYGFEIKNTPNSILVIPFISIMLPIVWVFDATIWINEIDKTFYYATFKLRRAYTDLYPNYPLKGKIVPSYIIENSMKDSQDDFMLFSGGLDAHVSFINNINSIKYIVNIQGWYNTVLEKNLVADIDFRDIREFSDKQGLGFYGIRSNFATLFSLKEFKYYAKRIGDSLWHGFQHSMAFISITIPVVYEKEGGKIIIASSFTVGDERVCASYPTTDNEFQYAIRGTIKHDGFELSRQDKVAVVVNYQKRIDKSYPLRVCSFNDHNCCQCEKCFRTILGLVAEGADLKDFGFYLNKPILDFYQEYFKNNMALFGVRNESITHWPYIKKRMHENYPNLYMYKDFVDWFLSYDFVKEKSKAVKRYYMKYFFSILRRKITS